MDHLLEICTGWFTCALLDHLVVTDELVLDVPLVQDCERLEHIQLHDHHLYIISGLQAIGTYTLWNQDWTFILPQDNSQLSPTQYCVSSHHPWTSCPDQDCLNHEGRVCKLASDPRPRRYLGVCEKWNQNFLFQFFTRHAIYLYPALDSGTSEFLWDGELVYRPSWELTRLRKTPVLYHHSPEKKVMKQFVWLSNVMFYSLWTSQPQHRCSSCIYSNNQREPSSNSLVGTEHRSLSEDGQGTQKQSCSIREKVTLKKWNIRK